MSTDSKTPNYKTGNIFKGIDKIVGTDDLRPMMCIAIIKGGKIIATDATKMIVVDLKAYSLDEEDIANLEGKYLDKDTLQKLGALKTNQKWFITKQGFNVLKANSEKVGLIYPLGNHKDEGTYPKYEAVIPTENKRIDIPSISFDANHLLCIQNVYKSTYGEDIGARSLKLIFHGASKPILVKSKNDYFTGLLMPLMINF